MRDALFRPEGARVGPGANALRRPWVLILDGLVVHCGERAPDGVPEGLPVAEGGWIVEPFADAHAHLALPGAADPRQRRQVAEEPREAALARILGTLEVYRRLGIAAVRDGGDARGLALEAATVAGADPTRYAAVLPAGQPIFRRGLYGGFLGTGVERVSEVRAVLEENCRAGASHAKVLATGANSLDEAGRSGETQFSPGECREIADAAGVLGLPLMVHANGPLRRVKELLPPGATLEHGFWQAEGEPEALAEAEVTWVPTLSAWTALAGLPSLTTAQAAVVAVTDERHRAEVERGRRAGAAVAAGSDAGSPGVAHGFGLLGELRRLADAGAGGQGALAAAYRARALCEREAGRVFGGLRVGASAGFIWLAEDPAANLDTLGRPLGVWLGGKWSPAREEAPP